jgi:hypothetical protein
MRCRQRQETRHSGSPTDQPSRSPWHECCVTDSKCNTVYRSIPGLAVMALAADGSVDTRKLQKEMVSLNPKLPSSLPFILLESHRI